MNSRKYGPRLKGGAFYSRNKRKRYTRTGKRYGSRRARTYTMGQITNARIGGLLGIERKYVDHIVELVGIGASEGSGTFNPVVGGPVTVPLNGISQGDGASNRDGRVVHFKSLQIRGEFIFGPQEEIASGLNYLQAPVVRFVVVMDRQHNATNTPPTWAQVFDTDLTATGNIQNWQAFRLLSNNKRYKILVDKVFSFSNYSIAHTTAIYNRSGMVKTFNIYRKLPMTANYTGTENTGAAIADNAIWCLAIASVASGSFEIFGSYVSRLRFCG